MFGDLQWISKYVAQNFAYILPIYTCTFTFAGDFGQYPKVVNFKTTFLTNFIFRLPMEKAHSCLWCGFCLSQWDLGLFLTDFIHEPWKEIAGSPTVPAHEVPKSPTAELTCWPQDGWIIFWNRASRCTFQVHLSIFSISEMNFSGSPVESTTVRIHVWTPFSLSITNQLH